MDKILDFKDYDSWIDEFKSLYQEDYRYKDILDDFRNDPNCQSLDIFEKEISEGVKDFINKRYTHIVYYHASATDNINSYLKNGILPSRVEDRINFARKLFNQDEYPELTNEIFAEAKNEFLKDEGYISLNEGKIYLVLDDSILKGNYASHYACYGGETLLCFANILGRYYKYELEKKLTPIIFKCIIPIELSENDFDDIARAITIKFFECMVFPKYKFSDAESVITVFSVIGPKSILGCEFPKNLDCE